MSRAGKNDDITAGIETLRVKDSKMPAAKMSMAVDGDSPFRLRERDVEMLAQSEGFAILREHLAEHYEDGYALDPLPIPRVETC